jgi:hypothetical protein
MDCTTRQLTVFVKPQMTDCGSESGKFLARKQARSTKGFPSPRDHGTCPGVPWIARLLTERGRLLEVTDYRIRPKPEAVLSFGSASAKRFGVGRLCGFFSDGVDLE